ncbi:MAG: hypothetical protein KDA31_10060 [Phycisphaerales bacterium]|nr:hypothetical protein [Phycisphaerales bacterium]MCB9837011.1 hypothetical protein [Phycisphaera sp.]
MADRRSSMLTGSSWPAVVVFVVIAGAACVYPLVHFMWKAVEGARGSPDPIGFSPSFGLLGETVGWAVLIGCLSVVIAWPGAWLSRGWRTWWSPVLVAPILMPSWLVYSGLGLLRGPGTVIGDWLAMGPSWRAVAVGRALAVVGLALWATPIAQLVIASRVREIDPASLEAARLVGRGPMLWTRLRLGMSWRRSVLAAGLVSVLMVGSAVPLHLAQMNTYATKIWLELDATTADERWRVVLAAWPVLVIVIIASLAVCAGLWRCGRSMRGDGVELRSSGFLGAAISLVVVGLAVVVPAALFALDLESAETISTVWRTESRAIGSAWMVAGAVGLIGAMTSAAVWIGLGGGRWARRTTISCVLASIVTALLPGVVTGVLIGGAWRVIDDSVLIVILAHVSRFLALPVAIGVLLTLTEPSEDRDLRVISGATGPIGWARTSGVRGWPAIAAGALAMGGLSMHEIESAMVVSPPGMASLARSMLNLLHFQRYEHLAGLALMVIGFGTLLVCGASGLWGVWLVWMRTARGSNPNQ